MTRLLNWKALRLSAFALVLLAFGGLVYAVAPAGPANVTQARLATAARPGDDWITHGGGWQEQRFSPLTQINDRNVNRLGLLWYDDLNTYRGVEATPLEIDGVLYNISAWDVTTAYDAVSGKKLWTYDPKIDPAVTSLLM